MVTQQGSSRGLSPVQDGEELHSLLQMAHRIAQFGSWELDGASLMVHWSEDMCRMLALPPGSSSALSEALELFAPEPRERLARLINECLHDGKPVDVQAPLASPDGAPRWIRLMAEALRDERQAIIGLHGVMQDISVQKQLEDKADRLAERFTNTLESITDAFFTVDSNWRYTYVNREAERVLQRSRTQLLGNRLWEAFPDFAKRPAAAELERALRDNCTVKVEDYSPSLGRWHELRAYPSEEGLTVYFRDITEAKKTSEALRRSEQRFDIIVRAITAAIWEWDPVGGTEWRSENMRHLFDYTPRDYEGGRQAWFEHVHPDDRARLQNAIATALAGKGESMVEHYRFRRRDGSYAHVLDRAIIMRNESGQATRVLGAMIDLSERKEAEEQQRLADARIHEQASLLDKAKDAIVVRGLDHRVQFWNKGAERLFGWTAEEVMGRSAEELFYDDPLPYREAHRQVLEHGEWSGETVEKHKNGSPLQVEVHLTLVRDESGDPKRVLSIKSDIGRRKHAEQKIRQLAFYDPLTGLPNRQLLMDRLQASLERARSGHSLAALLFIDLDNFKNLNDSMGHAFGDMLLQQVACRLSACVRQCDTVARLGGDEFVIILDEIGSTNEATRRADSEAATRHARMVGEKILAALNQPFQLNDHAHYSTPSIGIVLIQQHQNDIGELLRRADMAMYQAKAGGRNTLRFFDPRMEASVATRATLELDMRQGLQENQFVLHYHPVVDRAGRVIAAEALVRWQHPKAGMRLPGDFIPLVEESGLMLRLGQWILESACRQLADWDARGKLAGMGVMVNISEREFRHPDFLPRVLALLDRTGVDPRRIKLELTETDLVSHFDDSLARMRELKARGVGFTLDDFGVGYSSLTYLKRLPLDALKIDRSFTGDLVAEPQNHVIADAIFGLGIKLGLQVIAKGVEKQSQLDFLHKHGCQLFQGNLFCKPVDAAGLVTYVEENQA